MKQIYILLIALLMGLSAKAESSGTCGPNLKWHLTDDGVLTITGKGEMYDYSPWGSSIKRVIIGDGVTEIGNGAFRKCRSLTSVTIPNSVTTIESSAFESCSSLTTVTIPNSVTTIGDNAFSGCSALTYVTISNSVTTIGGSAFSSCSALTFVTIPNSVTTIGDGAFSDCSDLTSVTIPNSVTTIGEKAFSSCSALTFVTIPNSVTKIGEDAFTNNLTKIIWLTNTPPDGYSNVQGSIHYVANDMYTGLSNKKVYPYLSSIFEVDGIKYVPVSPSERTCDAIDCTYTGDELKINKKVNYKGVDMTVREINPYTAYSANIKKVYIENGFTTIGVGAFSSCRSLTSVTIPNSVTTIEYGAFSGCSSLTSVIIPNSVKTIGAWAFGRCMSLTSVTIPNSVKTIERFAFYNCNSLTSVTIPNSVTTIEQSAFSECRSLNSVAIPNSVTKIENGAFSSCSSLTSVIIPNSVTTIGGLAFSRCTNLQKVNIGNSVKTIGKYAFNNCTSITQISSEAVVPPICDSDAFYLINKSKCKLIVPKNSIDAYKQAPQWKEFLLIEGSTTGITNTVYNKAGLADVYTIDGTKRLSKASTDEINALPKGVYIVNGKKIIIK